MWRIIQNNDDTNWRHINSCHFHGQKSQNQIVAFLISWIPSFLHSLPLVSHLSCFPPFLCLSFPASHLSGIPPVWHFSCFASLLSFIPPFFHPSFPASFQSCIPHVLYACTTCPSSHSLHLTYPEHLSASHLSCIPHVLNPSCTVRNFCWNFNE